MPPSPAFDAHIHVQPWRMLSPDVMRFTAETNDRIARLVRGHEDRLVTLGSVHPMHSRDRGGDVERLADPGVLSPRRNVEECCNLPLAAQAPRQILYENAVSLFGAAPPAGRA